MTLPLVVGADGSGASLEAVDWAAAEAVRHGAPLHVLHAAAGDREASGVLRAAVELLLGSVALAVAARSHCPVVVVRGEARHRETRFGSVVVGVEAGEGSDTAVEFAFREARARRCRLVAVHAWNPRFGGAAAPGTPPWYVAEAHR
ncbi:universal stress protein, partial [Streptomyces sp. SID10815]|uniref:universal stress protein n=1 Tax=Streptomyces sp. SID10815 TaxID=2706027 RepID=UPI0013C96DE7|nr:universal stress protein [Streptomyces sp. SID10815]